MLCVGQQTFSVTLPRVAEKKTGVDIAADLGGSKRQKKADRKYCRVCKHGRLGLLTQVWVAHAAPYVDLESLFLHQDRVSDQYRAV